MKRQAYGELHGRLQRWRRLEEKDARNGDDRAFMARLT